MNWKCALVSVLCLANTHAYAVALSWEEAVREVVQNNPDLKSASASLESSQASVNVTRANFLPQASASIGLSKGETDFSPVTKAPTIVSTSAGLSVSEDISALWTNIPAMQSASAQERLAELVLQSALAKASYDLKTAWADKVFSADSIKLAKTINDRRVENLRLVELRFESGQENKGSLLLSKAYMSDSELTSLKADHAQDIAIESLRKVLNLNDSALLTEISTPPPEVIAPKNPDFNVLLEANPDYQSALQRTRVARAQLHTSEMAFGPSLSLTSTLGRADDHWFPENNRWSVGATLTLPLFTGGRNYYGYRAAEAGEVSAAAQEESVKDTVTLALKNAYSAYVEAVQGVAVAEDYLLAQKTRAEIARSEYNNGLVSFDDWDLIENDLITRETAYVQSKKNKLYSEAAWEQSQGKGILQ